MDDSLKLAATLYPDLFGLFLLEEYREKMVETIAELDEDLTMKFLEGEEISIEELKAALRKGVIACEVNPVFCGTAYRNKGVQLV